MGTPITPPGSDWNAALALRDAARAQILRYTGEPDLASEYAMGLAPSPPGKR
jgi:hypothetical protein